MSVEGFLDTNVVLYTASKDPEDAAIVAAAKRLGANTLFSEDLSDGQQYDGVKVVDPFRHF
jgi:predicted nucleic acid-binding protein